MDEEAGGQGKGIYFVGSVTKRDASRVFDVIHTTTRLRDRHDDGVKERAGEGTCRDGSVYRMEEDWSKVGPKGGPELSGDPIRAARDPRTRLFESSSKFIMGERNIQGSRVR